MAEPLWSAESFYKKEQARWNAPKRLGGMNANGFEEYPRMLYKAQLNTLSGKYEVLAERDILSLDKTVVIFDAEQFNRTCQLTVNSGDECDRAKRDGWRESPADAMAFQEEQSLNLGRAAAERAYEDRNMSDRAKAEAREFEGSTDAHVGEVPEKPRRGRPPNAPAA